MALTLRLRHPMTHNGHQGGSRMKSKAAVNYQCVLRAIGHGIEKLGVESFDLEMSDNHGFVVSGTYRETKSPCAPKPRLKKSFLSLIINAAKNNCKQKTDSTLFHFSKIRFTRNNIELLDQAGKASRTSWDGNPLNPLGISHVLRMAGAYLDSKGSLFLRLSWRHDKLTVWHFNGTDGEAKEMFTPQNLYDQWVHHFKTRKPHRLLKPTGSG